MILVTELEEGEVGEDDAVCAVASEVGCGCYEIKLAAGGRANLIATEPCCVLVDDDLLKQVNCTASVNIATALNFSFAMPGQRIATVKSAPFAVAQSDLAGLVNMLKDRGPIMQARPIRQPSIGILYTDPVHGDRAPNRCLSPLCASAWSDSACRTRWFFRVLKKSPPWRKAYRLWSAPSRR